MPSAAAACWEDHSVDCQAAPACRSGDAADLQGGEALAGARRDYLALALRQGGEDVAGELVEFGHVGADEGDASLLKTGDKMHGAGEPIELRDNEAGAPPAVEVDGFGQFGPVVVLARLLFFEGGERRGV